MKPNVFYFKDEKEFIKISAEFILNEAVSKVSKKGSFNIMLSGGSTPKKIYDSLTKSPYIEKFPWKNTYFFLGDERILNSENSIQTNAFMINEALFSKVKILSQNIIFPDTTKKTPEEIAADYGEKIKVPMDLILLGMGADAHTASMFPLDSIWINNEKPVISTSKSIGNPQCHRVSIGLSLINNAKNVLMLISGSEKKEITQKLLNDMKDGKNSLNSPIPEITPKGEFIWHVHCN